MSSREIQILFCPFCRKFRQALTKAGHVVVSLLFSLLFLHHSAPVIVSVDIGEKSPAISPISDQVTNASLALAASPLNLSFPESARTPPCPPASPTSAPRSASSPSPRSDMRVSSTPSTPTSPPSHWPKVTDELIFVEQARVLSKRGFFLTTF